VKSFENVLIMAAALLCNLPGFAAAPKGVKSPNVSAGLQFVSPDARTGASQGVVVDDLPLVHTAQFCAVDRFGHVSDQGDAQKQTLTALANLTSLLLRVDSEPALIVKLNVYLAHERYRDLVQQSLARGFAGPEKPAVSYIVTALPNQQELVALDAVAVSREKEKAVKWYPGRLLGNLTKANDFSAAGLLPSGPKIYLSGMADTNDLAAATRITLEKITSALGHLDVMKPDIVQLTAFLQPMKDVEIVKKEVVRFFGGAAPPVIFIEWISPAPNPPIEIEAIAAATGDFSKETNSVTFLTPPGTTGTKVFSRVARVNHGKTIYLSDLCGVGGKNGEDQIKEIYQNLKQLTDKTGSDFEHLVKATYYVSDDDASNKLNDLRPQYYNPQRPPAASKAKVKSIGLPERTVSLDMIAVTR
jgi:enamine deaminase RidA (YjgF/YER057c/UK114 family)